MPAVYPVSVKMFQSRTDAIDTVYAANVNDLQNEVGAIEATLGTTPQIFAGYQLPVASKVMPPPPVAQIGAAATYTSVGARLDTLQQQLTWVTQTLQAAGVSTNPVLGQMPVTSITCPGMTIPAGFGVFYPVLWGGAGYDPYQMYQGGTDIACPVTGWWQITASVWGALPNISGSHAVDALLMVDGIEVATAGSRVQIGVMPQHRLNMVWSGPWTAGQTAQLQLCQNPGDGGPGINARASISLSYLRNAA